MGKHEKFKLSGQRKDLLPDQKKFIQKAFAEELRHNLVEEDLGFESSNRLKNTMEHTYNMVDFGPSKDQNTYDVFSPLIEELVEKCKDAKFMGIQACRASLLDERSAKSGFIKLKDGIDDDSKHKLVNLNISESPIKWLSTREFKDTRTARSVVYGSWDSETEGPCWFDIIRV